jgi:hypothetical protein
VLFDLSPRWIAAAIYEAAPEQKVQIVTGDDRRGANR